MELLLIAIAWIIGIIIGLYFNISIVFILLCLILIYFVINKRYKKCVIIFVVALIISNIQINLLEKDFKTRYEKLDYEVEIIRYDYN